MLKAIVLDFNGVIVDDEPVHCRLLGEVMAPFGLRITEKDYYERYIVFRDEEAVSRALEEAGEEPSSEAVAQLVAQKRRLYLTQGLSEIRVFPGVQDFIVAAAASYRLAIASAAARQEIEAVLAHLNLSSYVSCVIAAEDVKNGKPAPDVYIEAISGLNDLFEGVSGLKPHEAVAIEDTPGGIASARAAGLRVAAVLNSFEESALKDADVILSNGLGREALDRIRRQVDR